MAFAAKNKAATAILMNTWTSQTAGLETLPSQLAVFKNTSPRSEKAYHGLAAFMEKPLWRDPAQFGRGVASD